MANTWQDATDILNDAERYGYVKLPDDATAVGYLAMGVQDSRRLNFVIGQINEAIYFLANVPGAYVPDEWYLHNGVIM